MTKIVAFSGSTREQSWNKKLVQIAAKAAEKAGAEVTLIDLKAYPLPIYDGDDEAANGLPKHAQTLKKLFSEHQGFLIASPEYNGSVSGVLKNMIDWVSRPDPDGPQLDPFKNKVSVIMSASPGNLGGLRGLVHVRAILGNLGGIVLPQQIAISQAHNAFSESGDLNDNDMHERVAQLGIGLHEFLSQLEK